MAAIIGLLFGAVLQKSGASNYNRLMGMLRFSDLNLLKMMLTAIGTASIGIYALSRRGFEHFTIKPLQVLMMGVGGLVFGVGFALNGYCPGTGIVASMEGKKDAMIAMAGGLLGSLAYAFVKPSIDKSLARPDYGKLTVDKVIKKDPLGTAIVFGICMIAIAFVLDRMKRR
jgi:uncharacterized membrane protein YedE/YeeE